MADSGEFLRLWGVCGDVRGGPPWADWGRQLRPSRAGVAHRRGLFRWVLG